MPYPIIDALTGSNIMVNGQLTAVTTAEAEPFFKPTDERMFYEVIRVVEQVPLFLETHLDRLERSLAGTVPLPKTLTAEAEQLIHANQLDGVNLRIVMTEKDRILHLTPSYYPDDRLFRQGAPTGILDWERPNPHIKIIDPAYKTAVAERFASPGPFGPYFELLLRDRQGTLTEGSRTNLFFICDGKILSAPDDRILLGITRRMVNQAIEKAGLELEIGLLTMDDIRKTEGLSAFLSGSPIDLLPIASIEDRSLNSAANDTFLLLNDAYQSIIREDIEQHKR